MQNNTLSAVQIPFKCFDGEADEWSVEKGTELFRGPQPCPFTATGGGQNHSHREINGVAPHHSLAVVGFEFQEKPRISRPRRSSPVFDSRLVC